MNILRKLPYYVKNLTFADPVCRLVDEAHWLVADLEPVSSLSGLRKTGIIKNNAARMARQFRISERYTPAS